MNIEEIRLTRSEIDTIQIPAGYEVEVDEIIANKATDKAIRKITTDLDKLSSTNRDDWDFLAKVGEYLLALKELVDKPPQATG